MKSYNQRVKCNFVPFFKRMLSQNSILRNTVYNSFPQMFGRFNVAAVGFHFYELNTLMIRILCSIYFKDMQHTKSIITSSINVPTKCTNFQFHCLPPLSFNCSNFSPVPFTAPLNFMCVCVLFSVALRSQLCSIYNEIQLNVPGLYF